MLRKDYEELYKVLGDQYGNGDGQNTFNIPDLRGRVIVGSGQGQNLNLYKPGDKGGEEKHLLSIDEMPYHTHIFNYPDYKWINYVTGSGVKDAHPIYSILNQVTSPVGGGQPHNNMQPYISIHPIIRIK